MRNAPAGDLPNAGALRAWLLGLGTATVVLFLLAFLAVVRSRLVPFGVCAILAAVSAGGWWYVASWNPYLPGHWMRWALIALAIPLVLLVLVWLTALPAARRRRKVEIAADEERQNT